MTGQQIINAIRGYIEVCHWVAKMAATGAAIAVALFVMVAERYGLQVPYVNVSSDVTTWAYLAGIYWLSR
jgi:hypothetical protein